MRKTPVVRFRLSKAQLNVLRDIANGYVLHRDPRPPAKVWMYHNEKRRYKDMYARTFNVLLENKLIHDPGVYFPIARFELTPKGKDFAAKNPVKRLRRIRSIKFD